MQLYKGFYTKNTTSAILMDDDYNPLTGTYRNYLAYYNQPQPFPRLLFGDSYSQVQGTVRLGMIYNFTKNDYIELDAENWASTPILEQTNQPYYVQQSCIATHAAGYNFSYSPECRWQHRNKLTKY